MKLKRLEYKFNLKDYIIVLAMILAPMTGLRVMKIGPAELLCLFWICINYNFIQKIDKFFLKFWTIFIEIILIGSVFGNLKYPNESDIKGIFVWVYFSIISICGCTIFMKMRYSKIKKIVKYVAIGTVIFYSFMYLYGKLISSYFLGAPLWFGGVRFSGGATNPHQVALLFCVTTIISFYYLMNEKKKVFWIILLFISFFLLFETKSSTGFMAVFTGITYISYEKIKGFFKSSIYIKILFFIGVMIFLLLAHKIIIDIFMEWVTSDSNGMGRLEIFSSIGDSFWKNPIFGLGPGTHGINGTIEFHNTYLEILAMGGLLGFVWYMIFSLKILLKIYKNTLCTGIMLCMYIFGFAGFSARRLVFWLFLPIIYTYVKK